MKEYEVYNKMIFDWTGYEPIFTGRIIDTSSNPFKILKYNDIIGNDYSDSIELYSSREECMKYACQNLKAYACGIADMQYIKEYITDKLLSRPEIDFKMKDKNVSCIITKRNFTLKQRQETYRRNT